MKNRNITIRKSATKKMAAAFPQLLEDGERWILKHYPDMFIPSEMDFFYMVNYVLAGGSQKSRFSRLRSPDPNEPAEILICPNPRLAFYAVACRQIVGLKQFVGEYDPMTTVMCDIIHEMTHHVQNIRQFHRYNETDTTINELCWLQEHRPAIYRRCWSGKVPVVEPAPIRPLTSADMLPSYRLGRPLSVAAYQELLAS